MNIVEISLLIRDPGFLFDYQRTGDSFWDVFAHTLDGLCVKGGYAADKKSSFQCLYYMPVECDAAELREKLLHALTELSASAKDSCSLAVNVLKEDGLERLRKRAVPGLLDKPWFDVKAAQLADAPDESIDEDAKKAPAGRLFDLPVREDPPEQTKPSAEERENAPALAGTVFDEAQRLMKLKNGLLAKVRGQRHAVDELVQSIFECEAFTARNDKRKGPLATFLFAGPSGVGKTFLAQQCGELIDRPMLVVDMSEYSDNLANNKFNGDHGNAAVVTGFVRKNPNGIILFDEIEKAHLNTIHMFLQILDAGRLMDMQLKREVSFSDTIIIMTTNAGKSLYEDSTVCNLSGVSRSTILDALRKDINPQTNAPFFPSSITTRLANGHVILFNHLEPYALMEIVLDEIALQMRLFFSAFGVTVDYDPYRLAATVLFFGGGVSDARTLRGLARSMISKELQEIVVQAYLKLSEKANTIKTVRFVIEPEQFGEQVSSLYVSRKDMQVMVFAEPDAAGRIESTGHSGTSLCCPGTVEEAKKRVRGVTDYVLIDPFYGVRSEGPAPNDIEDLLSDGMELFTYLLTYYPEVPVYILNTRETSDDAFETLYARGARGAIPCTDDKGALEKALGALRFSALVNNAAYALKRSSKLLSYNCAQYFESDGITATVRFNRMHLKPSPSADDAAFMVNRGTQSELMFANVIGCKAAKEALSECRDILSNPREAAIKGVRIPKGVLLYGPPGTGKTMLAKAMANETDAAFFPTTATTFFGSLVGESERNIRELFAKARRNAPSIIFIDEVDAIGRMRTGSIGSTHNEDALNAFIAEMEGFKTDEKRPVFILAATNYEIAGEGGRVLDPAFVRRFDRKIRVNLPDADDRFELLTVSLKKHGVFFGADHEAVLRGVASRCGGMSNSDIDTMIDMYLRAVGDGEPDSGKFTDAVDAFRFGEVNKLDPASLRQTAGHEAGHALVSHLCGETPAFLTVVSRGNYGGYMEHASDEKKTTMTYNDLLNRICCSLAGRAAEIELFGDDAGINTGASADLQNAREHIRACLNDYAMGQNMFVRNNAAEAEKILQEQFSRARTLIFENRWLIEKLIDLLVEKKSLDRTQLCAFFSQYPDMNTDA